MTDETEALRLNPEALEKCATLLKEISESPNAKDALVLMREGEKRQKAELEAKTAESNISLEQVRGEEQRKTIEFNAQQQRELTKINDEMERIRSQEEDRRARERNRELVRMEEDSSKRQEAIRRQTEGEIQAERRRTELHRAELEKELIHTRVKAETHGKIESERVNEDVHLRAMRARAAEAREKVRTTIEATFKNLGGFVKDFVSDPRQVGFAVLAVTGLAVGVFTVREGSRVAWRQIDRRWGKPSLVRETSRMTNHFSPISQLRRLVGGQGKEDKFADVVLNDTLEGRIRRLATSTAHTQKNMAPYRNMLFFGPPGTGKTMVAKRLSHFSGLDYAIMSGGDVGPLKEEAVTEIHKMFDWSDKSKRGLLLFIDEADAFLAARGRFGMSEDHRNALNALLYRTGEASQDFMMVLATNRPGDLDPAVIDRVDEVLEFALPEGPERLRLVKQYFDKYVARAHETALETLSPFSLRKLLKRGPKAIEVASDVTEELFESIAARIEGFSAREISKMMISVQATIYGVDSGDRSINAELLNILVDWKVDEHNARKLLEAESMAVEEEDFGGEY